MWKNLNFNLKVSLMVSVFILFSLVTAVGYHLMANQIRDIGIKNSSDAMLNGYKGELKDIVDLMAQSLSSASEGVTDENEVYDIYAKFLKDARFFPDKSGYIFVYKTGGTVFLLPPKPELEGKDLSGLKDANGKLLIKELDQISKQGGGFVEYLWDKPGKGNLPKLSYARMIPGKPYWLGTGVYVDDVQEKEEQIFKAISDYSNEYLIYLYAILGAIFLLVIFPLTWLMIKSIVNPLISLTQTAQEYSKGKLDTDFIETDRSDEIGALARAVKRLGRSTKIVMEKLNEA